MDYIMKNLTLITSVVIVVLALQACGGNSKKVTTPTTPTTPTAPVTPEAVHHIQPEDVAGYVEKYKTQQADVELQLDGVKYELGLVDFSQEEKVIVARYEKGFVLIGFDFGKEEPRDFFRIIDSDSDNFEEAAENPIRVLDGLGMAISSEDDNAVFTGSVVDVNSLAQFNIRLVFNESLISGGSSVVVVSGTKAMINGDLGTKSYVQITDLINNHPEVNTLLLQEISGSVNDEINMHTGRLVRNAQLTTMVEATSDINSGGVDLYAAGFKRIYTEGAKLGVHSWCCTEGKPANELGRDHKGHGAQLTFFREMLGAELGPEFYFFTIEAAPHDTVHVMTKVELDKYLLQ